MKEFIFKSELETCGFAKTLAQSAKPGDIFALSGDLGSGKTTFAKCFGKALGIESTISSPTFTIMKSYTLNENDQSQFIHIDCYRLNDQNDFESAGLCDEVFNKNNISLIEWPEKIWSLISKHAKLIKFEYIDESTRKITLNF